MILRLLLHSILVTHLLRSERVGRGDVVEVNVIKGRPRWRTPKCYIIKGGLRRRLFKGGISPSVKKINACGVTPLSNEPCSGDHTKPNEHYEEHIRTVCEELKRITGREDKLTHLMRENTNVCTMKIAEPMDRTEFTLGDKSQLGFARRHYFINEVREGVLYKYVERCNSNLYLAVDVVEAGQEQSTEVHSSGPTGEQSIPAKGHSGGKPHWRSILGRKKFLITVDGFSDNIVLCCFLRVLLRGLNNLDVASFLNMGFERMVKELSSLYTIHVNGEHIVGHVMDRVRRFVQRLSRGVAKPAVSKRVLGRSSCRANTHMRGHMRMHQYPRVAHMLSGGVDSLMALRLLEKKKFHVHNFFLHFAHQDCSKSDLKYVKQICEKRKNLFIININEEYTEQVLIPMLRSYSEGQIPNADVMCNEKVKYNLLMKTMRKLCRERGGGWDYSYVSTGHYAMISTNDEANANRLFSGDFPFVGDGTDGGRAGRTVRKRYKLIVGRDEKKDQTFFLSSFAEKQLSKFLFPLCLHTKSNVKRLMEGREAGQYNHRETRGLCLYGRVDMHSLLGLYFGGASGQVEAATNTGRGLEWVQDQLRSPEFRSFQEKHLPSFSLRFKNYIINVDDGTVLDTNDGIHLYAIGQNKYITNYLHQLYTSTRRGRTCEKNFISSCQWTVVYKKMLRRASGNVKENFIYVSRDYASRSFRYLRGRCRLGDFRWVASAPPSYLLDTVQLARSSLKGAARSAVTDAAGTPFTVSPATNKLRPRVIFVKIRNSEEIKEARIALDDMGQTAYLTLKQKDIGLSPGQIITFYLPFIVKRNGQTKYVYSLKRGRSRRGKQPDRRLFFYCLGSARIINQYLNRGLYQRLMQIHRRHHLPLWGREAQCGNCTSAKGVHNRRMRSIFIKSITNTNRYRREEK
ncbi:hypothetical protein AK88_03863 [Plasmodium fragile]|uniref:tRNA methyl transferase n=1 Tax=Plasmodium fragile TaxID=5857 RepID=A0A0D9QI56_PLAFR|nr:uncharacterized protein AK88_03863 [Plasmodium fragile]KJP86487.1 hypothetical protein AK88_03863 [Plasmodium fragile]